MSGTHVLPSPAAHAAAKAAALAVGKAVPVLTAAGLSLTGQHPVLGQQAAPAPHPSEPDATAPNLLPAHPAALVRPASPLASRALIAFMRSQAAHPAAGGVHHAAVDAEHDVRYVVQPGDTLFSIAQHFYSDGDFTRIFDANHGVIKMPGLIFAGQVITIPGVRTAAAPAAAHTTAAVTGTRIVAEARKLGAAAIGYSEMMDGGTGPQYYDCSGLVQQALEHLGVKNVPRTSEQLSAWATPIPRSQLQPGDLVFAQFSGDTDASPGHVGLYAGDGQVYSAQDPLRGIGDASLASWAGSIVGYGKVPAASEPATSTDTASAVHLTASPADNVISADGAWSIFDQPDGQMQAVGFAHALLTAIGAPITPGNVKVIYDWMMSEGSGGRNNPLNGGDFNGLATSGQQYGGGANNYPSLAVNARAMGGLMMTDTQYGYGDIVDALRDNDQAAAIAAILNSQWAASHYGWGDSFSDAPVPGGVPVDVE